MNSKLPLITLTLLTGSLAATPVISVNFTEGDKNQQLPSETLAGKVKASLWNNLKGKSGNHSSFVDHQGNPHSLSLHWQSSGTWWDAEAKTDAEQNKGNAILILGYLDDNSQQGPSFHIPNPPFQRYQLILYFSTDTEGSRHGHPVVNGVQYQVADGKSRYTPNKVFNDTNSLHIENLSGPLSVKLPPRNQNIRSSIAGFQLINVAQPPTNTVLTIHGKSINLKYTGK